MNPYRFDPDRIDGEHFILTDDHQVVSVSFNDFLAWQLASGGEGDEEAWAKHHLVEKSYLGPDNTIEISTVFYGRAMSSWLPGPPLVFESLVFRDGDPAECRRYATWDDAVAGHAELLALVKLGLQIDA